MKKKSDSELAKIKNREFDKRLTDEEREAPSYLDWSNERLGEFTRLTANYLKTKTIKGYESVTIMSALFLLVSQIEDCNAGYFNCTLSDVTSEIQPYGASYKITVRKLKVKK